VASICFDAAELDVGMIVLYVVVQKFGKKMAKAGSGAFLGGLRGKNNPNGHF
jgi:hypothetical protein